MNNNIPLADNNAYKSLLYWRKNLWNGSDCVPVILTLENNTLAMKQSDDSMVFSESLDKTEVKFSGWGTMTLTVTGKKYDIVGMPAATSPEISDSQKTELSGLNVGDVATSGAKDAQPAVLGGAVATTAGNAAGSAGATIVGAAISSVVYYRGLTSIREWKALIGSAADQKLKLNNMTYFIAFAAIALVVAIALK